MRQELKEAISRMTSQDCKDVAITCHLPSTARGSILIHGLADEDVAEYVLQY